MRLNWKAAGVAIWAGVYVVGFAVSSELLMICLAIGLVVAVYILVEAMLDG